MGCLKWGLQPTILSKEKHLGNFFFSGEFSGSARAAAGHGGGDLSLGCAAFENSPQSCWKGKLVAGGGGWEVH